MIIHIIVIIVHVRLCHLNNAGDVLLIVATGRDPVVVIIMIIMIMIIVAIVMIIILLVTAVI